MNLEEIRREINRLREEVAHLEFLIAHYANSIHVAHLSERLHRVESQLSRLQKQAVVMERNII